MKAYFKPKNKTTFLWIPCGQFIYINKDGSVGQFGELKNSFEILYKDEWWINDGWDIIDLTDEILQKYVDISLDDLKVALL